MFREGLALTLRAHMPQMQVLMAASGAQALLRLASEPAVEMIVADYFLPDLGGADLIRRLRAVARNVPLIVLSSADDQRDAHDAFEAGASAFVHKSSHCDELFEVMRRVAQGERGLLRMHQITRPAAPVANGFFGRLTSRQCEVLRLIGVGLRNREIGERLAMTEKTVKNHISSIFSVLGVPNRTQAALLAVQGGLCDGVSDVMPPAALEVMPVVPALQTARASAVVTPAPATLAGKAVQAAPALGMSAAPMLTEIARRSPPPVASAPRVGLARREARLMLPIGAIPCL
ncbi:response regulator transcription factor [Paraburkholderia bonniea]|nr:response regulator transcription factor [Paraburkholderia bonniea]WJF89330.1 response regulator transcription factor [Paraburkholderia bonniea]WJF92646.1 response regulator transcription factor [Paraburkholderia bonniea]